MTTYGHDPAASTIVAVWTTGDGAVAHKVARVPPSWGHEPARLVTGALTVLSARLWLAYADRSVGEVALDRIADAAGLPAVPFPDRRRYETDDCLQAAYEIGRLVSRAPGRAFRDAIVREVVAEVEAVRAAERGDLSGRAQQAVAHPRPDVPEARLAAAHALLERNPLGPAELSTTVEPTAAGVAALRWLRAAGTMTAALAGHRPADVIALAEAIEHEDLRVARIAMGMLPGSTEPDVVASLLHEAVLAGRGHLVVCPDRYEASDDTDAAGHRVITTVLDPREPGRSLVGGLVRGIQGCFRVYVDEISTSERPPAESSRAWPVWAATVRSRFCDEVRRAVRALDGGG